MITDVPKAFQIAAQPISKADWLAQNAQSAAQIAEKHTLITQKFDAIWCDNGECAAAQAEALAEITHYLGTQSAKRNRHYPPLLQAALLVQDDLVLMQKTPAGWRLAVGAVCFPSSWRLGEKFNRPLADMHADVPGFGPHTHNAKIIERMFDRLQPDQPLMRGNWGVMPDDELFHPHIHRIAIDFKDMAELTFRHERQTIMKLRQSGLILFTIRISVHRLDTIKAQPTLRVAFKNQLMQLSNSENHYKALINHRHKLIDWLKTA